MIRDSDSEGRGFESRRTHQFRRNAAYAFRHFQEILLQYGGKYAIKRYRRLCAVFP